MFRKAEQPHSLRIVRLRFKDLIRADIAKWRFKWLFNEAAFSMPDKPDANMTPSSNSDDDDVSRMPPPDTEMQYASVPTFFAASGHSAILASAKTA